MGVQGVVRKLIWLVRRHHKTQNMIVEVVHGSFSGAMARFRKADGEAEKWEEQHEKTIHKDSRSFSSSLFILSLSLSLSYPMT